MPFSFGITHFLGGGINRGNTVVKTELNNYVHFTLSLECDECKLIECLFQSNLHLQNKARRKTMDNLNQTKGSTP